MANYTKCVFTSLTRTVCRRKDMCVRIILKFSSSVAICAKAKNPNEHSDNKHTNYQLRNLHAYNTFIFSNSFSVAFLSVSDLMQKTIVRVGVGS